MSTPIAGALAATPAYIVPTSSDTLAYWDDPGQTWRSVIPAGAVGGGPYVPIAGNVTMTGNLNINAGLYTANPTTSNASYIAGFMEPNLPNGGYCGMALGVNPASNQAAFFQFNYNSGTPAASSVGIGVWGHGNGLTVDGNNNVVIGLGSLGVGVAQPSDTQAGSIYLTQPIASTGGSVLAFNAYQSTSNWKLITAGSASVLNMGGGGFQFFTAPSGAAGSVPAWAQKVSFDASGNIATTGNVNVPATTGWITAGGNTQRGYCPDDGVVGGQFQTTGNFRFYAASGTLCMQTNGGSLNISNNITVPGYTYIGTSNTIYFYDAANSTIGCQLNLQVNGFLATGNGQVRSQGSGAGLVFSDRGTGQQWQWWADGNSTAHLWYGGNSVNQFHVNTGGNITQNGLYHYFAGATGNVNSTGGSFIYADNNNIVFHVGTGGGNPVQAQNTSGTTVFTCDSGGTVRCNGHIYCGINFVMTNNNAIYGNDTGGTARPMIYMTSGNQIYVGSTNNDLFVRGANAMYTLNHIAPNTDNSNYCGVQPWTKSWYQVQSYNFYTTPSGREAKTDLDDLPDCLDLVKQIKPQRFRWRDQHKDEHGRVHWGFIAQDVGEAMDRAGHEFGGHIAYRAGETVAGLVAEKDSHALAYNELLACLWKAVAEMSLRLEQLETRH